MYRVDRNDFYDNQKQSTIYTPDQLSRFIFEIMKKEVSREGLILDPCAGKGALLKPWVDSGYRVLGVDIEHQGFEPTRCENYLSMQKEAFEEKPALVIMNPPFNIEKNTKEWLKENIKGRPLLPELFLGKSVSLFGVDTPIILFTPYGLRLNQTSESKRIKRFLSGEFPEITSIISLPKDVFEGVLFHSEILLFNTKKTKPHYFYGEL